METAAIGGVYWAERMFRLTGNILSIFDKNGLSNYNQKKI
jgi:hypothetical protein